MRKVTVIPATINPLTGLPTRGLHKRKAAAYARVSTDSDEQATSLDAQSDYYPRLIQSDPELEYVGLYTDDGISGTSIKKRDGFNRMIKDALEGKIDIIFTKSVSRFARNTTDCLNTIRKLREAGVEVYFEKENIRTMDSGGELLITLMASIAQEEVHALSQNVTWGKRKSAADGKISLAYKNFLGYDKGPGGVPVINPEQAEIVRRIYRDFMRGKTTWTIAEELTAEGIPTPGGKTLW
ncbi:MAG: recombinase family protein, partial [Clostridia bacterium]|nr:recombinase family protein [Clostridia bacterium]